MASILLSETGTERPSFPRTIVSPLLSKVENAAAGSGRNISKCLLYLFVRKQFGLVRSSAPIVGCAFVVVHASIRRRL